MAGDKFDQSCLNMNSHHSNGITTNGVYCSTKCLSSKPTTGPQVYRLYKKRWFMLFIVCLLNVSTALLWINFSAVANFTNTFYNNNKAADMLSLVYMIVAIPVGFLAMWSVDSFGLNTGIWLGTLVTVLGATLRVISSISSVPSAARFPLVLTGQIIASIGEPFIMYLPTKLAAQWFPDNHRALANTLGSMANPLGAMISMFVTPQIVNDKNNLQYQFLLMNSIMLAPAALIAILVAVGVWSSKPPTPPTVSAAYVHLPFWPGFKKAIKTKSFMILVLCIGGGVGHFNAGYTLLDQILCPKGYPDFFSGICGGLMIGGGLIGSVISGMIVDKTKRFEEVAKVCYSLAAIAACFIAIIALKSNMEAAIAVLCTLFGAFGFSIYPIGMEMAVECTYPVAEATTSGLIIISGQIQGIIYVLLMSGTAGTASEADMQIQQCSTNADVKVQSWQVPNLIFCGIAVILSVIFVPFFWPKFKRMEAESKHNKLTGQLVQSTNCSPKEETVSSAIGGSSVTVVTIT